MYAFTPEKRLRLVGRNFCLSIPREFARPSNIGAEEDWNVAQELARSGHNRHCLFLAHLALEKVFKAAVCKNTGRLAPPIHNLVRLFERSGIQLEKHQIDLLAEVNQFNIEGRYPELSLPPATVAETDEYLNRIREVFSCLKKQFFIR